MDTQPKRLPALRPGMDEDWSQLCAWLPGSLEELATSSGALVRRRVVRTGAQLVRLVLSYALGGLSLRETAAWAARALHLQLTDAALAYRFVHALPLLEQFVAALIHQRLATAPSPQLRLRLLDATTLSEPGGRRWRLHLTYCPAAAAIVGVELTDVHGAEHMRRAACAEGDLVIGDRGYGHARDLRALTQRGAEALVRVDLHNVRLTDPAGRAWAPSRLLKMAREGHCDHEVLLHQRGHKPLAVRLLLVPMPQEQAARARQRLRRTRKRKTGGVPRRVTLRLAGYVCCLTTLDRALGSGAQIARWYGVRWQVELLFKRCKSLLHLQQLTKARAELVRVQIWARILVALLVERLTARSLAPLGSGAASTSPWRLTRLHWLDLVLTIYGGTGLLDRLAAAEVALPKLHERRRRRRSDVPSLVAQIEGALVLAGGAPGAAAA